MMEMKINLTKKEVMMKRKKVEAAAEHILSLETKYKNVGMKMSACEGQ